MEIESSINEAISIVEFNDKVKGKVPKIRTDWLIWKLSSLPLLYHIILSFIDHGNACHNSLEENTYICIIWFKIDNLRSTIYMKSVLNCRLVWPHCCHRQWAHYLNWGTWDETETETETSMGERGECTTRSWLHIVYKVWKYLRLYMKTFAYKTVDRWKLWLMIERLNVHNCIQRVRQGDRGGK